MKRSITFLFALIFVAGVVSTTAQRSPRATVEAFYRFDSSHSQIFNRRNIDARKRWLSAELYRLFLYELRREADFVKKHPDEKPFFGDGLPFQPLQEMCEQGRDRTVVIKQDFVRGTRAAATATFAYPKPCRDADPLVYTIGLTKTREGWVIDDINFGEDTSLKQRLQRKEY
jgi:hypothetical protein